MEKISIQYSIRELKALQIQKDLLNDEIKRHELILKNYMIQNHIDTLYGNEGEKVNYLEIDSNRFDTKEFKKHFEHLYSMYLKKTKNWRFKFTY